MHQKFEGTAEMLGQESRVNHRLFLVGVSVEVTAHILHAVQNVPCLALGGTFKYKVLHKMRHTLLVFKLVARTRIYGKTTPMIKISLRSVGTFPCNQLAAEFFNGGGHLNASGGEFFGTIEEAKSVFEQALEKYKPLLTAKS